jgi:hypothetical protein
MQIKEGYTAMIMMMIILHTNRRQVLGNVYHLGNDLVGGALTATKIYQYEI